MKIAIDLTQIPANKTGIGIYALNLVDGRFNFFFFVQNDDEEFIHLIKNFDKSTLIPVDLGADQYF